MYCEKCRLYAESDRCPHCENEDMREAKDDDVCFLIELSMPWSGTLSDVLRQNNIPFITEKALGAAVAIKLGNYAERYRFFVLYQDLAKAKEITETLFSSDS